MNIQTFSLHIWLFEEQIDWLQDTVVLLQLIPKSSVSILGNTFINQNTTAGGSVTLSYITIKTAFNDANGNDLNIYFPKNRQFVKEDFTVEQKDGTRVCVV